MEFLKEALGSSFSSVCEKITRFNREHPDRAVKLANLSGGDYVSKAKYRDLEAEVNRLKKQTADLVNLRGNKLLVSSEQKDKSGQERLLANSEQKNKPTQVGEPIQSAEGRQTGVPAKEEMLASGEQKGVPNQSAEGRQTGVPAAQSAEGRQTGEAEEELFALQALYKKDTEALKAELDRARLDAQVDLALEKSGARNIKAARALLDFDKLTLKAGEAVGLDQQIDAMRAENGFLFSRSSASTAMKQGGAPAPDGFVVSARQAAGLTNG